MGRIRYLTDVVAGSSVGDEVRAGLVALENESYEQAWNHIYKGYTSKEISKDVKGQVCYLLTWVLEEVAADDPLIDRLTKEDLYLSRNISKNKMSQEYCRKYLARKFLEQSAQLNYSLGLIDYSLNCVGYGLFPYENDMDNIKAGLDWALVMKNHEDQEVRAIAHIIFAKKWYHERLKEYKEDLKEAQKNGDKVNPSRESMIVKEFGENILKANAEYPENDYVKFFLANLKANVLFKGFKDGAYYDPTEAYKLTCDIIENDKDVKLVAEAKDLKDVIQKNFPKVGR